MRSKYSLFHLLAICTIFLLITAFSTIIPAKGSETDKPKSEQARALDIRREVYYESDKNYPNLPELVNTIPKYHPEKWAKKQFGVDENPRGIIGNEVVNYSFITPKGWKVSSTYKRFSSEEDGVIFRLTGRDGIWGAVYQVDLSDEPIETALELARYFSDRRPHFFGLLKGITSEEVKTENHLLHGFSTQGSEMIIQYESYSTVELAEGRYASVAQYYVASERGYVVDIYIPSDRLNERNRSTAYIIGKSFIAYRFG